MKEYRNPEEVHSPLGTYTQHIEVSDVNRWLVFSGQIGMDKAGNLSEEPVEQFRVALDNISLNLAAAGMGVKDLVKLTFYFVGDVDPRQRGKILKEWLGGHEPCMTLLQVAALAAPTIFVEIDAEACV
jgi:enamine deaminase RidA (YjgF/YER057c/UK114 family)